MKKIILLLSLAVFLFSCSDAEQEKLSDPQIDAKIGVELEHYWNMAVGVISPDGTQIATSSYDGMGNIIIWDMSTKHQVMKFACPSPETKTYSFNTLAYSAGGSKLVAGTSDKLVLFDMKTGKEIKTIEIKRYSGKIFASSNNGKYIAVNSDTTVQLIDVESASVVKTFTGHTKYITDIQFSADDVIFVSAAGDKTVRFWNVESGEEIRKLDMDVIPSSLAFNEDASKIAIGLKDESLVQIWDLEKKKKLKTIEDAYATSILYINGEVFTQNNARIDVYSAETGEEVRQIKASGWNLSLSPDKKYLVNSNSKGVIITDFETGNNIAELGQETRHVSKVHVSPTGRFIVTENTHKAGSGGPDLLSYAVDTNYHFSAYHTSGSGENLMAFKGNTDIIFAEKLYGEGYYYDLTTGQSTSKIEDKLSEPFCITNDGNLIIGRSDKDRNQYAIFNAQTGEKQKDLVSTSARHYFSGVTPDDKYFVLLTMDFFKVFELATGAEVKTYEREAMDDVVFVDQTVDGKYVIGQAESNEFKITDILTGEVLYILEDLEPKYAALSPDKKTVAIACKDWTVKTYSLETKAWVIIKGHAAPVVSVTYTPNGKFIVSSAQDSQTKIWDATTGAEVLTLVGLEKIGEYEGETVDFVVIAPNGRYDGSPAGIEKYIFFEKDGKRLPAATYKDKCYTPNLLGKTLGLDFIDFTTEEE